MKYTIYLDFDGTIVEHEYPNMGRPNFGCVEVIKKLQEAGHEIILNTYRANCNDGTLQKALDLLNEQPHILTKPRVIRSLFMMAPITEHTPAKIHPPGWDWNLFHRTGEIHIDDQSANIPLKVAVMSSGWMVDWDEVDRQFEAYGLYKS